jgi:hypothetical protein
VRYMSSSFGNALRPDDPSAKDRITSEAVVLLPKPPESRHHLRPRSPGHRGGRERCWWTRTTASS